MKKNYDELGILIDDAVLHLLNHAVQLEGRQSKLARAIGIPEATLSIWMKKTQKETTMISWDQWKKAWKYLKDHELIDGEDPKWMLPSQMRERLSALSSCDGDAGGDGRRLLYLFGQLNAAGRAALLKTAESLATTPGLSNSASHPSSEQKAE